MSCHCELRELKTRINKYFRQQSVRVGEQSKISQSRLLDIQRAARAACGSLDGVKSKKRSRKKSKRRGR